MDSIAVVCVCVDGVKSANNFTFCWNEKMMCVPDCRKEVKNFVLVFFDVVFLITVYVNMCPRGGGGISNY